MTLIDALERLKTPIAENARLLRVFLACGFTPLHLETFLAAHLRNLCSDRRVELQSGLLGDLSETWNGCGPGSTTRSPS